jgi:hypothetical protein
MKSFLIGALVLIGGYALLKAIVEFALMLFKNVGRSNNGDDHH